MSDHVTDEMVETAARAEWDRYKPDLDGGPWEELTEAQRASWREGVDVALAAAIPLVTPADRQTIADDATQRLARAAFAVDSKHHFHEGQDGRPTCSCGFVGDARKRTQTEHITAAVIEEYDHD